MGCKRADCYKQAKCIGRESNPGLAESLRCDLEWQRPILPLNHQCYVMGVSPLIHNLYA
jgi:hypothetical protein